MNKVSRIRPTLFLGVLILISFYFFLKPVFSGQVVLPQVFYVGSLSIHIYGLIIALAVALAYWVASIRAPRFGLLPGQVEKICIVLIVCGFVGARMYHVFSDWPYYLAHPGQILAVWQGGLGIFGAVFGGLIGLLILQHLKPKTLNLLPILDWLTPSLLIGQIIGRFGNLFNYEAFGYATQLPWKMFVPTQFRPIELASSNFFHPLFLYEAVANAIIFIILVRMEKKFQRPGVLFLTYLLMYNGVRFFLELLRTDSTFIGSLRLNSLMSGGLVLAAIVTIIYVRKKPQYN